MRLPWIEPINSKLVLFPGWEGGSYLRFPISYYDFSISIEFMSEGIFTGDAVLLLTYI